MRISREADYAVRCLVYLASHLDRAVPVGEIAGPQEIPASFLAKILGRLARAGILSSTRGPGGGFRLAKPADGITLRSVVTAVAGPLELTECLVEGGFCPRSDRCGGHAAWTEIREELGRLLDRYTIGWLLARETGIPSSPAD